MASGFQISAHGEPSVGLRTGSVEPRAASRLFSTMLVLSEGHGARIRLVEAALDVPERRCHAPNVTKRRLDTLLLDRGLVESREKAHAVVLAGAVTAAGRRLDKPGTLVDDATPLDVAASPRYVGRGGEKLEGAIAAFSLDPSGLVCADVGASTGGFTDCLLQHGAVRVYAIDVGYGQLDYRLRIDPRVAVMERVNARYLESLPALIDLATVDVSFISLTKVLPAVRRLLRLGGRVLVLLKPQFEGRRDEVGKGGIVRDPLTRARIIGRFANWAVSERWLVHGPVTSRLPGHDGNLEYFFILTVADEDDDA